MFVFLSIPVVSADTTFFDNPDDVFVMGDSSTGGNVAGEITGGSTGSGDCIYKWNCTNWRECLADGKQARDCINIGTCPDTYKSPSTEQNCDFSVLESEEKTEKIKEEKDTEGNLFLLWIAIGIVIGAIILSKTEGNWEKKIRKTEGTILVDKSIIEILKENMPQKNLNGKWIKIK